MPGRARARASVFAGGATLPTKADCGPGRKKARASARCSEGKRVAAGDFALREDRQQLYRIPHISLLRGLGGEMERGGGRVEPSGRSDGTRSKVGPPHTRSRPGSRSSTFRNFAVADTRNVDGEGTDSTLESFSPARPRFPSRERRCFQRRPTIVGRLIREGGAHKQLPPPVLARAPLRDTTVLENQAGRREKAGPNDIRVPVSLRRRT